MLGLILIVGGLLIMMGQHDRSEALNRSCASVWKWDWCKEENLSVDGSFVEANAAKESRIPRQQLAEAAQVNHTVRQYLVELEQQNPMEEPVHQQDQVSTTDPDSDNTHGGSHHLVEVRKKKLASSDTRSQKDIPITEFFNTHRRLHIENSTALFFSAPRT